MNRVKGKVAIVTGAAGGLGAAFVRVLVKEGAQVVATDILDVARVEGASSLGAGVRFLNHDVTKAEHWERVIVAAEATFGPVNVLVNNAGIVTYGTIESQNEEDFRHVLDVNLVSTFLGMKAVLSSMRRAGGGAIINISSAAGLVGNSDIGAYTASKFGIRGLTKVAALEFSRDNIQVNSIHPGLILTPMTERGLNESQETVQFVKESSPAGRFGLPEEVANLMLLLASDEAKFSTGCEFIIDGGLTCR